MKIGCSEMPKQSYLPYFDQLSETGQPLSANSQILFGTTMVLTLKVLVTSTVKILVKKLIEAIVNMYMKTGKI